MNSNSSNTDHTETNNTLIKQQKGEITHPQSSMIERGLILSNQLSPLPNPFENIRMLYEFPGIKNPNDSVIQFSPCGSFLAASVASNQINVWDMETGDLVGSYSGLNGSPTCIDISKRKNLLAAAGDYGRVVVWDIMTNECIHQEEYKGEERDLSMKIPSYRKYDHKINCIKIHKEEDKITLVGRPGLIILNTKDYSSKKLDIPAGRPLLSFLTDGNTVLHNELSENGDFPTKGSDISISVDGNILFYTDNHANCMIYDMRSGTKTKVGKLKDRPRLFDISSNGKRAIIGGKDHWAEYPEELFFDLVDISSTSIINRVYIQPSIKGELPSPSSRGHYFSYAQGEYGEIIRLTNLVLDNEQTYDWYDLSFENISLSEDGSLGIVGSNRGDLLLIDYKTLPQVSVLKALKYETWRIHSTAISSYTKKIAVVAGASGASIFIWSY